MVRKLYPTLIIDKLNEKRLKLSPKEQFNIDRFLELQFWGSALIFISLVLSNWPTLLALLVAIIYAYMLYYIGVLVPLKRRKEVLEHEAIIFFETLALSLESGANLEQAIDVSVDNTSGLVSDEFKKALMDLRFGKTLEESLSDMTKRIPSNVINNTIINIHQSLKLGSSIVNNLYEQINYLQETEISALKKHANTIPTKISIISVILFIPLVLLLILAPILLNLMK